jgi:type I restriction enzyme S subunit
MVAEAESPLGRVPSDWRVARLADLTTKIGSGATPRGGESAYLPTRAKYALIRSQNVVDRHFESTGLAFVTDEDARRLNNVEVRPRDILLNITGDGITFSRACMVDEAVLPARVNQHVSILRVKEEILDPGYLLSYLVHPKIKTYMESFNAGGSRRALTKGHIESFVVPLPPLHEQRAIAHILGTLDDKIELNRRMNETLEAMTRAIFKSWFVDFDPVRAKMEGRQPVGMDAETAVLFPDSFEDSPLGRIPKGWITGQVRELADLSREALNPGDYPNEAFDHYSIPAFDETHQPKVELGEQIKSNKFVVLADSVLLSKLNPRIPRIWLPVVSHSRRSVCSTEFLVALPKAECTREYLYSLFSSDSFLEAFSAMVTGTSGSHQRVKPEYLIQMEVVIPSRPALTHFSEIVRPLHKQAAMNLDQSRTLATIRDVLLSKLLSGEVRVDDLEWVGP